LTEREAFGKLGLVRRHLFATVALALAVSATSAAGQRSTMNALSLKGSYLYTFDPAQCPPGTAQPSSCFAYSGHGEVRGLGQISVTFLDRIDTSNAQCVRDIVEGGSIADAHGSLIFSAQPPPGGPCIPFGPGTIPLVYTITGGTGAFAGASGTGTLTQHTAASDRGAGGWDGTVSAPGYTFDVTPPVFRGAVAKSIAVAPGVRTVRVRFSVRAVDAVDGKVPATCVPRSGSRFRAGRTKVRCTAADSSANSAGVAFTITVRHR
jgi:hypothetical protein